MTSFNIKLKNARLEKKLTQKELAQKITELGRKTSNTAIANWESGLNKPDIDTLELICKILNKDGNYFFDSLKTKQDIDLSTLNHEDITEVKKYVDYIKNRKK